MNSRHYLFIKASILLAIVLIVSVPLVDILLSLIIQSLEQSVAPQYSSKEMIAGIVSETLRAFITCYLYSKTLDAGLSLKHGIRYGLLYSALIASLYIILGGFYFQVKDPMRFVLVDGLILLIQGIASGFVLFYVYRQKR